MSMIDATLPWLVLWILLFILPAVYLFKTRTLSQQEREAAEQAAWLAGGKEICINCRISAGEFDEKIEVALNQRLSVSTAKTVIVQKSSYEHSELVAAGDVVLEMGNTALDDAKTLEDEGVEEGATLTMVVDDEVTQ